MLPPKKYPKTGTISAKKYYYADLELSNFLNWIVFLVITTDRVKEIATEALELPVTGSPTAALDELRKNRIILMQMLFTRNVDNFLTYLSDLLHEAFLSNHNTLKTSEKIEIAEVLKYENKNDLISHLAEKKVHSLSYESISVLSDYFSDHFNIDILQKNKELLTRYVEDRNLITHNRGIINSVYISKTKGDPDKIGERRSINIDVLENVNMVLFSSVSSIDKQMRSKINIKGKKFNIIEEFNNRQ